MNGQCLKDITSGKSFDIFLECVDKEVGKYICRKRQTHACNGHLVYIAFPLPVRASPLSPSPVTLLARVEVYVGIGIGGGDRESVESGRSACRRALRV